MMNDLGIDLKVRMLTDSSTGKAISARRGLGKIRHMACHELWLQDHVAAGTIEVVKIKNTYNTADILTKHLSRKELDEIVDQLGHNFVEGRSEAAPELSLVQFNPDTWLIEWRDGFTCNEEDEIPRRRSTEEEG